jgi:hypothetical protein
MVFLATTGGAKTTVVVQTKASSVPIGLNKSKSNRLLIAERKKAVPPGANKPPALLLREPSNTIKGDGYESDESSTKQ